MILNSQTKAGSIISHCSIQLLQTANRDNGLKTMINEYSLYQFLNIFVASFCKLLNSNTLSLWNQAYKTIQHWCKCKDILAIFFLIYFT